MISQIRRDRCHETADLARSLRPGARCGAAIACQRRLSDELTRVSRLGRGEPIRNHRHFLLLYFHTTDGWIRHAAGSGHAEFIHDLVGTFYWIYDDSIGRYFRFARCDERYRHWAPYCRSVQRLTEAGGSRHLFATVYLGARAHTRYDLREAIVRTYRARRRRKLPVPSPDMLKRELFGRHSDRLFQRVFATFCMETLGAGRRMPNLWAKAVMRASLVAVAPLWVRCFQHWREQAFAEAMRELGPSFFDETGPGMPAS